MGTIRQTLLTDGNYICPKCQGRVTEEVNAETTLAYAHKICLKPGETLPPPPPPREKVREIESSRKQRMSDKEKEEFKTWKEEKDATDTE